MGWNYLSLAEANHEAHHATVAALSRITIHSASIDSHLLSAKDLAGLVQVSGCISRRGLKCRPAAILAPWIAEGRAFAWPLNRSAGGDETAAAIIVDVLDMTRGECDLIVHAIEELLGTSAYRAAVTAVAAELLREGALSGERIRQIVGEAAEPIREMPGVYRPPYSGGQSAQ